MPFSLFTFPEELLVQHILPRLDLSTLKSCSTTCRQLNHTIKSSLLVNYSMKLQEMNLIDNPDVSYDKISLDKRLDMLREYKDRRGVRWKTSAAVLPGQRTHPGSIKGEAGVLYIPPFDDLDDQELHWTTLPSKEDQAMEWNIFRPSNPVTIISLALSIEENDLLAFATWNHDAPNTETSSPIQIHLIQHSTQVPYPGLFSPILDIGGFRRPLHGRPVITVVIRGTNMAVMVGQHEIFDNGPTTWAGHLSVWNWRTGEKKCEKLNLPDMNTGVAFLREDILLHGCSMNMSLDVYHISTSAEVCELRLIERLGLPILETEGHICTLHISFATNPTSVSSFTESSSQLFAADTLSSILMTVVTFGIYAYCEYSSAYCLFITHLRTLLGRADRALSRYEDSDTTAGPVEWEKWGPDVTGMFWYNQSHLNLDASCGSRLFLERDNSIDVYDFVSGRVGDRNYGPSPLVEQGDAACQRDLFQDVVHTKLPFVYRSFGSIEGVDIKDWHSMYVDQSRIVGIQDDDERIYVLFIG